MSPMEKALAKEFREKDITYVREVIFEGCINPITNKNLRYDFYLPDYNMLIEYDGIDFHKDDDVKHRDRIKDQFAKTNKIKMVRISGGLTGINYFIKTLEKTKPKKPERSKKDNKRKDKKITPSNFDKKRFERKSQLKNPKLLGLVLPLGMDEEEYRKRLRMKIPYDGDTSIPPWE